MKESDLYPVLKTYLEARGYTVKSEVGDCDIMARRGDDPPVVVEMKLSFSLTLVLQGIARQTLFDTVYLAVPKSAKTGWSLRYRDILALCRRLGLGLLSVDVAAATVTAHLDPGPYVPRKSAQKSARLLREFDRRVGDPNVGGTTRRPRMTVYRQDALRCLAAMAGISEAASPASIARLTGVARTASLLRDDHYGWFDRIARGAYVLSPKGRTAVVEHAMHISLLLPAAGLSALDGG